MRKKRVLLVLQFLLFFSILQAQEIPTEFDKGTLEKAVVVYKRILTKQKNLTVSVELGEALYLLEKYQESSEYYSKVIDEEGVLPIHYRIYGEVLAKIGHADSEKYLGKYKKIEMEAALLIKDLQSLTGFSHDTMSFFVNKVPFNSMDADYSPIIVDSSIYFVSSRKERNDLNIHEKSGEFLFDFYKVNMKKGGEFSKVQKVIFEGMNHDVAEGPVCFSPDKKEIYFNRNFLDAHGMTTSERMLADNFQLMHAKLDGYKLSDISDFQHLDIKFSSVHPYVSKNGKELYFACHHPEGQGGYDIYVCYKGEDGKWQKPTNLGPTINTAEDELYPYLDAKGNLYFASKGHLGLGGLDLFVSHRDPDWTEPINLGTPFNSHYDDFGVCFKRDLKSGFFSSDRPGGMGGDDIYYFKNIFENPLERKEMMALHMAKINLDQFPVSKGALITGGIRDKVTGKPIKGVWVVLIDEFKQEVRQAVTDENGVYSFQYMVPGDYLMAYEEKPSNAASTYKLLPSDSVVVFSPEEVASNHLLKVEPDPKKVGKKNLLLGTFSASGMSSFVGKDVFLVDKTGKIRNHSKVNPDGYYSFKNVRSADFYVMLKEKIADVSSTSYLCNLDSSLRFKEETIAAKESGYDNLYPENADAVNLMIAGKINSDKSQKVVGDIPVFMVSSDLQSVQQSSSGGSGYFTFFHLPSSDGLVVYEAKHQSMTAQKDLTLDYNIPIHVITKEEIEAFRKFKKEGDKNEKLVINGKVTDIRDGKFKVKTPVYLLDEEGRIVAKTETNVEGYFLFPELSYENSYKIIFKNYEPHLTIKTNITNIDPDLQESYGKDVAFKHTKLKRIDLSHKDITINGKVIDNLTHQPVSGMNFFVSADEGKIIDRLTTNKDGSFFYYNKKSGNYYIVKESIDSTTTVTINSKRKSYSKSKSNIEIAGSKDYQLFNSVYFDLADHNLNDYAKNVLGSFEQYMKANKIKKVVLNGYGDLTGSREKTLVLTSKRATACKDFLDFKGIDFKKIELHAKGMTDEFKNENNEYDPALNRKVDILFLE